MRAGQAPVQVPVLPGRHVDADQRARQRHAADGPLPLSQGGGRLPHQAAGLPEPRRPDRLPVQLRLQSTECEYTSLPFHYHIVFRGQEWASHNGLVVKYLEIWEPVFTGATISRPRGRGGQQTAKHKTCKIGISRG